MEVIVSYSPKQVEDTVEFIAQNNSAFKNKRVHIRKSIQDSIREIAQRFPDLRSLSTMGYMVVADSHEEGIDQDVNHVRIEIYVDPALASSYEFKDEYYYFAPKE